MLKTRLKDYIIETNIGNVLVFEMYNTTISRGEGVKVIRKVKTRDKVTIIKAAIFVLTLTALAIIVLVYSNFSLRRSLDTISYRQLENIANSRIRSVNLFLENKFRVLDMMSRYISENGEDDFWKNASDLSIEANDFIVLGVSDVRGNAYCKTCDKDEIFEDIFPDADKVLKYGYKAINVTDECGGVPAFVVAVPIYKHRHITGAVFAGVSIEKIEEILETSGSNKNIAIFVADENEKTIVGNEDFNSHKNVASISDYFENDDNLESVLSDIKEHKSGHSKIVHDGEDTYVLYQNTNVNHYSIFVTIGKTDAYKDAAESQRQYRILSEILIAFIIVLTSVSVFVLVGNARRLIKLSEIEISKKDYKEEIYRSAILSNCLAFWEVNLTDGTVVELSDLSFIGEKLPENLILSEGKTVRYDELMDWLADKMGVVNRERYDMVNSVDYLLSRYNNDERMVELFCQTNQCGGMMCRKMYYMYENKFDRKVHAFCIIHDITETYKNEKELKDLIEELKVAKIKNSTSQMQPHFLYNALASIREIILDDPQYASDLVFDFTTYLRACIRSMSNDNFVPFRQELDNIQAYVNIEKMRFGDKLKIEMDIEESDFKIVPLSIQPLVENAIRHGIYQRGSAGGTVTVKTFRDGDKVVIQVIDDGVGFDCKKVEEEIKSGERDSSGIENVKFRLGKMMNAKVEIESEPDKGTVVTVRTNVLGGAEI